MPTLNDDEFLAEVDHLIHGRESSLKVETPPATETPAPAAAVVTETPATVETPVVQETPVTTEISTTPSVEAKDTPAGEAGETPAGETPAPGTEAPVVIDYKAIHDRLFGAPIRAGGQDLTLANVDEAISLIQKGVGFHNKMNKLQGDMKYVQMLRNNDLLDEGKLSFLIDVSKKSPGAIKKLLDEGKIDPLALDTAEASTYAPSDHRVTDEQVRFQSVVEDLTGSPTGTAILHDAKGWDQASKAEVYKSPDVLTALAHQKDIGRYDLIKAQVDRQKLTGTLPAGESFLVSYTRVGQQMMQAGAFGQPTTTPTPTPVAQKTVTPVAPANAKKAAAAAPTKAGGKPAGESAVDIKQMSDDEFEKHFKKVIKI